MKPGLRWLLILLHALAWLALAACAYATAGPYKFASCWQMIPLFLPPIGFLLLAVAACSAIVLLASLARPSMSRHPAFLLACHGAVLTSGMIGCVFVASMATGPVSCL